MHVAGLDERVRVALAGPGPVAPDKHHLFGTIAGVDFQRQHAGHDGVHIVAGVIRQPPVRVAVVLNRDAIVQNILDAASPSVAALVCRQTIKHGAIGCLL